MRDNGRMDDVNVEPIVRVEDSAFGGKWLRADVPDPEPREGVEVSRTLFALGLSSEFVLTLGMHHGKPGEWPPRNPHGVETVALTWDQANALRDVLDRWLGDMIASAIAGDDE